LLFSCLARCCCTLACGCARRPLHVDDGLAERLAALAELNPEDRASLLSVLDALLTRTRVRALTGDAG
jgi:hypothetical protein